MASMDRTQGRLGDRVRDTAALARLHLVTQRVFSSLVMSDDPVKTPDPNQRRPSAREEDEPEPEPVEGPPPRLLLEPDASGGLERLVRQARIAQGGSGGGVAAPQRLEVVLSRPPVPHGFAAVASPTLIQAAAQMRVAEAEPDERLAATRGALELRPDRAAVHTTPPTRDPGEGWTLWWRPLPLETVPDPRLLDPTEDPAAIPIASGLVKCQWTFFHDRQQKPGLSAVSWQDLPAYVRLEVQTTSGLTADWVFEVEWSNGPEMVEPEAPAEDDPSAVATGGTRDQDGSAAARPGGGRARRLPMATPPATQRPRRSDR
jgi:hypothetical protein